MELGKRIALVILLLGLLSACHKDYGPQAVNGGILRPDSNAVIIVNEGNFQWGNASLGQYNPERKSYEDGLFRNANNQPLGDVLQEAHRIKNRYYLVMNGSNELVICDLNWKEISASAGINAPVHLAYWENSIWLSDLYSPKIRQYDLDGKLLAEFNLGFSNARMFIWEKQLHFYQGSRWKYLESVNASLRSGFSNLQDIDQIITIGEGIIISYENGNVYHWPSRGGNPIPLASFQLPLSYRVVDESKDRFFSYDGDSLYVHNLQNNYARSPLIAIECENFYGLSFHAPSESLFLFDARSFVQPHRIRRINPNSGTVLDDFQAGALPSGLVRKW